MGTAQIPSSAKGNREWKSALSSLSADQPHENANATSIPNDKIIVVVSASLVFSI